MASSFKPQRARNRRTPSPVALSSEQIDGIITTASAYPRWQITRDVVELLSETGMRSKELCNLRVSDIDIAHNRLHISGAKTEGRYIPLTPRALNALQSLRAQYPSSSFVLGDKACLVLRRVSLTFRKIAGQIGVEGYSLHSLRHFFAMRLAYAGVDPMVLARLMGHSSLRLTERYFKSDRS